MTDRDEERFDAVLRANDATENFTPIMQRRGGAGLKVRLFKIPTQSALGTSDQWTIQAESQMRGNSQPARVCNALSIEHDYVWFTFQLDERLQQRWGFAKRQQTRYVRK